MIYLDNAATTYPKPEAVYEEMNRVNRELAFNAGRGSYSVARDASKIIDETRRLLIELVHGCGSEKVVITTSATEALNIILQGIPWDEGDVVYVSPYEHNAVARVLELIKDQKKIRIELLPIKEDSLEIDVDKAQFLFVKDKPKCVCCTHVSNVTGYILPVNEIFSNAHKVGAITVMDGSQSVGLVDFDIKDIGADFIAFAGHKTLYGPFGVGGFYDVREIPLNCVFAGGTGSDSRNLTMPQKSPEKYEAGSKNIVAIAGLRASLLQHDTTEINKKERKLTDYLISELKKIHGVLIYCDGLNSENHIGIVSFNLKGYLADEVGSILADDYDIAVRTGFHCAPYVHELIGDLGSQGTVRIGISHVTTENDIKTLLCSLKEIMN